METIIYEEMNSRVYETTRSQVGFTMMVAESPKTIENKVYTEYQERFSTIIEYFSGVINVFREAANGQLPAEVLRMLFGDAPANLGVKFHKELADNIITRPAFFRTDEATPGKILEIQSPGSQWGDYQLVVDTLSENGYEGLNKYSLCDKFTRQLEEHVGDQPLVHHLLDNSSIPHTMLYFIQRTRPKIKYFGYDRDIRPLSCNFVRSHSVYGLVAENFFLHRIRLAEQERIRFDLPPFIPFDEKISFALPFMEHTKDFFSNKVREMFAFTHPIVDELIHLEDGSIETIESFSTKSRPTKNYFLKYAGSDVSINWGSRAVFRLSNDGAEKCLSRLRYCLDEYREKGRCWVIQKEEKCYEAVQWVNRAGITEQAILPTNYKGFYGPSGFLAVMAMHRNHYKIHGQEDTVISICVPGSPSPSPSP